jgi:outer membrane protein OmpA-like peptidoglycan-associated protein
MKKTVQKTWIVVALLFLGGAVEGWSQVLSGASFLNVLPGARLQAMSGSLTGGLDEMHAIYANPGTAGFLREWQWSAAYTKWIADVYNASLVYGMRLRTPWSPWTRLSIGLLYQGMPDFDSSDGATPTVSANDMILSASLGQPLSGISKNLSVGTNVKYLRSKLAQFDASSLILDVGLLYRTPRFRLPTSAVGLFDYGIVSAGVSLNNIGNDLTYINSATPLPRVLRTGLAFNAGVHDGLKMQISLDYLKIRDEKDGFAFGTEISWNRLFAIDAGYDYGRDLLSRGSVGVSINLDDIRMPANSPIPGRSKAIRFELATLGEDEFVSRTYRGGLSHYAIGPEAFRFREPSMNQQMESDSVLLEWEESREPDLYDDLFYFVLVNKDSSRLATALDDIERNPADLVKLAQFSLLSQYVDSTRLLLTGLDGGDYYWAVVAHDKDFHPRFAERDGARIAHFAIPYPDLLVKDIRFDYDPWITTDDYQGILQVTIANTGNIRARNVDFSFVDSAVAQEKVEAEETWLNVDTTLAVLSPLEEKTFTFPWHTSRQGLRSLSATLDAADNIREDNEANNHLVKAFYTIPKGPFAADDTSIVKLTSRVILELPVINDVSMDTNRTVVELPYLHKTAFDPPLGIFAKRLKESPNLALFLDGYADPNSENASDSLALARATAVRDSLIKMGVDGSQLKITGGQTWPERRVPKNPTDALWVFQERRAVKITADKEAQKKLFAPVMHVDDEDLVAPVLFKADIVSPLAFAQSSINMHNDTVSASMNVEKAIGNSAITGDIEFPLEQQKQELWLHAEAEYLIQVWDGQGRTFKTKSQETYITDGSFLREHRLSFPLKFGTTKPLYDFYWDKIYSLSKKMTKDPDVRMRFEGHACKTGPEQINLALSDRRAKAFYQGFLDYLKKFYPQDYEEIKSRMDEPKGYGEAVPLAINRLSGEVITIGDNDSPIGRKFNRRIEIVFYSTAKTLKIAKVPEL